MTDPAPPPRAVVFDAYGTLLDVHAAVAAHAAAIGPTARQLSADWRTKQLEYTWVRSLTGPAEHVDFRRCTADALDYVFARHGLADAGLRTGLLDAYGRLAAYPEVPATLRALRAAGLGTAILSNGTPDMLAAACDAAGITPLLDAIISVEDVGVFKPDPRVYRLAETRLGHPAAALVFVSGNAWDGQAAHRAGFRVMRVNRDGAPDEYGLRGTVPELPDLAGLPALLAA